MARRGVPIVGVTTYRQQASWGSWDRLAAVLPASYPQCVSASGGRPVLLAPCEGRGSAPSSAAAVVDVLDALVLSGGGDVDPDRYGQAPHAATSGVDLLRDADEFALVAAALEADLPLLAICRGMQVLDVLLGGTLLQHVPDAVGHDGHQPARGCFADVEVATEPGSTLAELLGEAATVRCSHHQSVDRLGKGLVATARSADGVVEGIELPSRRFVVGVQWHPEEQSDLRLFEALVEAAR
jgi:gamma-glutamyl-gamma-aminobutyrate hydrolase PuuD